MLYVQRCGEKKGTELAPRSGEELKIYIACWNHIALSLITTSSIELKYEAA